MTKKREPLEVKSFPGSSMRILLSGDLHGSINRGAQVLGAAMREKCSRVAFLGDFGYWEHTPDGVKYLNSLSKLAHKNNVEVDFLDGNHDNHPLLWQKYCQEDSPRDENGFFEVRSNIHYISRGQHWQWGTQKFAALGGAHSKDKEYRIERETQKTLDPYGRWLKPRGSQTLWWETETITEAQLELAISGGPADIILTHDAPSGILIPERKDNSEDERNRQKVRDLVEAVKPKMLFHGHFHIRKTSILETLSSKVEVTGLGDHRTPLEEQLIVLEC